LEEGDGGMADLLWEVDDGVGLITLNRPDRKNAFSSEMLARWEEVLVGARDEDSVKAIVVTGAGAAFCAGGDVKAIADPGHPLGAAGTRQNLIETVHRIPYALERLDTPVIAAVNGPAVGAGMDMALMCDLRFVGRSARFSEGYIRAGLIPGDGGCFFLPRLVGIAKALELLWSADFVDAEEAVRLGIANRLYDDDRLLEETLAFARRLAHSPPVHVRLIKRNVYQSYRSDLRTSLELAASHMGIVRTMADSREAVTALLEKRDGTFTGT
jgi:enoyl-CoA hydratase/carnithine racemase